MPRRLSRPLFAFDLRDDAEARVMAQKIADKIGQEVVVTSDADTEVCTVRPATRRNDSSFCRKPQTDDVPAGAVDDAHFGVH
jgi:hypothetical protein